MQDRKDGGGAHYFGQSISPGAVARELRTARSLLEAAQSRHPALAPAIRALARIERRLGRTPRVALLGEFNSGKSSLANIIIGEESLPTAVISNTRIPTLLAYASEPQVSALLHGGQHQPLRADRLENAGPILRLDVGLPAPSLKALEILDLPGLADAAFDSGISAADTHRVDAIVWCTVSTQAWKESERSAWADLPPRLKARGILAVTHWDLLRDPEDQAKLLARLEAEVGHLFVDVIPIRTRDALRALGASSPGEIAKQWGASGAARLDAALMDLVGPVREQRVAAALALTRRIVERTLDQIGGGEPDLPQRL